MRGKKESYIDIIIFMIFVGIFLMNIIWVALLYTNSQGLSKTQKNIFLIMNVIALVVAIIMSGLKFYNRLNYNPLSEKQIQQKEIDDMS